MSGFRGYLVDHHSPPPPTVDLSKLDPKAYVKFYKEAHIDHLMVYCKDHWGRAYYPTKVGKVNESITCDWIGEIKKIVEDNDIEFNAYYSIEYDEYIAREKPEWAIKKEDGSLLRCIRDTAKWGMACYMTGYREYAKEQIREIISGYHPQYLFLDIFGKSLCYCDHCKRAFKEYMGYPLPEGDFTKKEIKDVNAFLAKCAFDFYKEIFILVKGIDDNLQITVNFASLYPNALREMLDFEFTEPWADNFLSGIYARDTRFKDAIPQMGPGDISDVYNYAHENVYKLAVAQIIASGCKCFMYSGSQRVDGTLELEEAKRVGSAYKEVERLEYYLRNTTPIAEIGILQQADHEAGDTVVDNAIKRCKLGSNHRTAIKHIMALCDQLKMTYKIIPRAKCEASTLKNIKLLWIVGFKGAEDEELTEILSHYVEQGGKVLVDASSEVRVPNHYAVDYHEVTSNENPWTSYINWVDDAIKNELADTTPPITGKVYTLENKQGSILASHLHPVVALSDDTWVNWWSPPPERNTEVDDVSILSIPQGQGHWIHHGFEFHHMDPNEFHWLQYYVKALYYNFLEMKPKITLDTSYPQSIHYLAYRHNESKEVIVHILSDLAEKSHGDIPPVPAGTLLLDAKEFDIDSVRMLHPVKRELQYSQNKNYSSVFLPSVQVYMVIAIKEKDE